MNILDELEMIQFLLTDLDEICEQGQFLGAANDVRAAFKKINALIEFQKTLCQK